MHKFTVDHAVPVGAATIVFETVMAYDEHDNDFIEVSAQTPYAKDGLGVRELSEDEQDVIEKYLGSTSYMATIEYHYKKSINSSSW